MQYERKCVVSNAPSTHIQSYSMLERMNCLSFVDGEENLADLWLDAWISCLLIGSLWIAGKQMIIIIALYSLYGL